jgi:hypothetical protein
VDYTPTYFLINGVAFSKDNQTASALPVPAAGATGNVLVRFVNAGSHMHTPSVNGLNALLVAEDANVLPDAAIALAGGKTLFAKNPNQTLPTGATSGLQLRTEVFQAAGKVMDVLVSPTQTAPGTTYNPATYQIYDRALEALTTNQARDGGMQAVLDVADTGAGTLAGFNSTAAVGTASYTCAPGVTLQVLDPGNGVIAKGNDVNVYGVTLVGNPPNHTLTPFGGGSLTLNPNGTFVYTQPSTATTCGGSFTYYANGNTILTATVNITLSVEAPSGVHAVPDAYNGRAATLLRVGAPGVLGNDFDDAGYPLTAVFGGACAAPAGATALPAAPTGSYAGVNLAADGGLTAQAPAAGTYYFCYQAQNSQKILSSTAATVTLSFPTGSGLQVTVQDAPCVAAAGTNATALAACAITDYKWIIEQDLTFPIDPACQVNSATSGTAQSPVRPAGCPQTAGAPPTPATNFHTSFMPVIAEGCTGPQSCSRGQTVYDPAPNCATTGNAPGCSATGGQHVAAACDGLGNCTIGATQLPASLPATANLSATNPDGSPASYYISILAGDSQNAFAYANVSDPSVAGNCNTVTSTNPNGTEPTGIKAASACGHTMGGAPVPAPSTCTANPCTFAPVTINLQPNPLPTATVTAFIFEDDYPLNGEPDTGGGVDSLATLEKPLGDFEINIWDDAGGVGDFTGQMTYDMFNMPLTNALNGTIDPNTGLDACPISNTSTTGGTNPNGLTQNAGAIITCPQYESDGKTPSPLTGQVVVKNLMQGKFSLIAHPGAAREAAGEEWLQTNSLDGGHFLDSFIKPGEPPYFAEFGPGGYHVFFGFANPKHINARLTAICGGQTTPAVPFASPCHNTFHGQVTNLHQDRSPSEELYSGGVFAQGDPGNYAPISYTNCYAAIGDTDGATIALSKCDPDGNFTFTGLPDGEYGLVLFDQWNDLIVDGSSHHVSFPVSANGTTVTMMYPSFTWQAHLWSRTYMDTTGQGSPNLLPDGTLDPATSPGVIQVPTRVRQTNGKFVNTLLTDIGGNSRFDETFPLFAFYTVESDNTRFRTTGIHVVNDNGGQVDGPAPVGNGNTGPYQGVLNSKETFSLPGNLSVPGAVYCASGDAACLITPDSLLASPNGKPSCGPTSGAASATPCQSTGRIDPGSVDVEGWQGGVSEFNMIDWGKMPYYRPPNATVGENGGIRGHVVNATTRPFDDPRMLFQNLWEPLVPRVTINLYQEGTAPDGVTTSLKLVDSAQTASWDDWAQGFGQGGRAATTPNMSCTGQDQNDPFFTYTLQGAPNYLTPGTAVPYGSQYKCYDGYHNLNQLQPAPYDGLFKFPSNACLTGSTFTASVGGSATPVQYSCVTIANPAFGVAGQSGAAAKILPPGKYVVEVVPPPGWQINKEEDLNLLIGDQYIAPATAQFTGLGSIFITPDQASIDAANPSYTGPYVGGSSVSALSIASAGTGYHSGDALVFTSTTGSGAMGIVSAVSATGAITGVSLTNSGSGYTATGLPTITITDAGASGANITAVLTTGSVTGLTIVSGGTGYFVGDPLVFTPVSTTSAVASVASVSPTGAITAITISNPGGGYASAPTVAVTNAAASGGSVAVSSLATTNGTSGPYVQPWTCTTPTSCTLTNPSTSNNGKQASDYGRTTFGNFGPGGLIVQSAPCVGRMRIVPDYLSISPESGEVAPFAGALHALCDRKEVTLDNQMQADLDFYIYTNTPKTTSFTGFISDDFSSEFDPASPAFGEKFAVPNVPVSIRDFNGQEISRVYSDQWGVFNGLVYSTWEVDPPNITGYSPNMMVTCMNDPGPIPDPNNPGQTMNDPLYNPAYSTFCYENAFMPGDTTYLDTPVVPVSAFAEGYNPPDCAYPDSTPMILSVTGDPIPGAPAGAAGPWVSAAGHQITINALAATTLATPIVVNGVPTTAGPGIQVPNNAYSGPAATTPPYNQKFVTRHYGFGPAPAGAGCNGNLTAACPGVTLGGIPLHGVTWTDAKITATVPNNLPSCPLLQTHAATGAKLPAQCGELVITAANGKQSIDTVTVTVFPATTINGIHNPSFVAGEDSTGHAIQNAMDKANPGDLVIVGCAGAAGTPGTAGFIRAQNSCTYNEMLLMWKPLRLQGIGDGAVSINANTHPAGKLLEPWRRKVNCLFGLALNGGVLRPVGLSNNYDPTGTFSCSSVAEPGAPVDALVGEPILGWDATLNGNLAELLQEPTLMGAYEGAGITVLGKGLENGGTANCTVENAAACIPLNSSTLAGGDCNLNSAFYTGNYLCNPSRIDGLTFTDSSQGGGGVYLHAFNHNTEVSNLNVTSNGGTLTGGITIGQMETVDPTLLGAVQQPMLYNRNVNVHNNRITNNAAYGDELNSNTPASAGGVTFATGADNYKFQYNWVCGNWSSGDGGGIAHHGFSWNGTIQNNWIVFNQSINPSLVTNGGGLVVHGHAPDGTLGEAGTAGDVDVAPTLTPGIGPGLLIANNVFQGNTAEEGQGGGLSLMHINGNDVLNNPTSAGQCGAGAGLGELWYCVTVRDNIFANNVAGWTGGGVSLLDAVLVNFQNNTVVSNDSTASAGVVFNSNGAPLGNVPPPGCNPVDFGCSPGGFIPFTSSSPLPAGFVTEKHSQLLSTAFAAFLANPVSCPAGHTTTSDAKACAKFSVPLLDGDIFWQNRSFNIATNAGAHNAVALTPNLSQTQTGGCSTNGGASGTASFWDIGVYGDSGPTDHGSGFTLAPTNSILSSGGYAGNGSSVTFTGQYCNGSRVPAEIAPLLCTTNANGNANAPGCIYAGAVGIQTNGGVPDSSVPPGNTINSFSISPAATVDEGSNWINMFYGPLSLSCMITNGCGSTALNAPLGNYQSTAAAGAKSFPPGYPNP